MSGLILVAAVAALCALSLFLLGEQAARDRKDDDS